MTRDIGSPRNLFGILPEFFTSELSSESALNSQEFHGIPRYSKYRIPEISASLEWYMNKYLNGHAVSRDFSLHFFHQTTSPDVKRHT